LYKLEYQLTAERYENIFKAIWQNFSYMTAISGAVLAFGGDRFQPHFLWFIACSPLVFWYWASFEPLNRYGEAVEDTLAGIEAKLNHDYHAQLNSYKRYEQHIPAKNAGWLQKIAKDLKRVTYRVGIVFYLLTAFFLCQSCLVAKDLYAGQSLLRVSKPETKIVTVSLEELQKLQAPKVTIPLGQPPAPPTGAPDDKH